MGAKGESAYTREQIVEMCEKLANGTMKKWEFQVLAKTGLGLYEDVLKSFKFRRRRANGKVKQGRYSERV